MNLNSTSFTQQAPDHKSVSSGTVARPIIGRLARGISPRTLPVGTIPHTLPTMPSGKRKSSSMPLILTHKTSKLLANTQPNTNATSRDARKRRN